jgi:copper chaperone CopZ
LETVIKTVVGDAAYKTEQEFNSVEDAYNDVNPITEVKATVTDIRVNSKKYKLKDATKNTHSDTTNNTTGDHNVDG